MDLAVVLLVLLSLLGAVGVSLARPSPSPSPEMIAPPMLEDTHTYDAGEIDDMFDLRR